MTEEELNGPEIGTGFEEMHSKCVAPMSLGT
jgi:hypothetical protein